MENMQQEVFDVVYIVLLNQKINNIFARNKVKIKYKTLYLLLE